MSTKTDLKENIKSKQLANNKNFAFFQHMTYFHV